MSRVTSTFRRNPAVRGVALLGLAFLAWSALAPVKAVSRNATFEIPRGTFARHMAGQKGDPFPETIRLTLGITDVLVLKNDDNVPHIFGPTLIMPGQSFRLPFMTASTYSFQCTAHPSGGLTVIVDPTPSPGWERLRWRWRELTDAL
jgi:hypothetical protein